MEKIEALAAIKYLQKKRMEFSEIQDECHHGFPWIPYLYRYLQGDVSSNSTVKEWAVGFKPGRECADEPRSGRPIFHEVVDDFHQVLDNRHLTVQ